MRSTQNIIWLDSCVLHQNHHQNQRETEGWHLSFSAAFLVLATKSVVPFLRSGLPEELFGVPVVSFGSRPGVLHQ